MQDKGRGTTIGWVVRMGVKGGVREHSQPFGTLEQAQARADRWRRSNSTGHYWAIIDRIRQEA